jgi:uncharacterized integral membrane protein
MASRSDVRLNEMKSLFDLGQFPLGVCAGAVLNVVLTLIATRWVERRNVPGFHYGHWVVPLNLAEWIAIVLIANLLPVILLRTFAMKPDSSFRRVREMSFFADQHRFPLWVYLLASANMATWIAVSWAIFKRPDDPPVHLALVVSAVLVTAFPAWIRLFRR